ncbi:MAG TPA: hypothetical protein VF614_08715, partial [Chthoniobacteraceae bacterium]
RRIIAIRCLVAAFIADAGEHHSATANGAANQQTALELQLLQGTWAGVMVDAGPEKVAITITGDSLHFHRDADFWFGTTITLPAGKDPKQLHATIKDGPPSQRDSIGQVVRAFFKIEDGTLTLATMGEDSEETPASFEASRTRYELRKVQAQKEKTESLKTE